MKKASIRTQRAHCTFPLVSAHFHVYQSVMSWIRNGRFPLLPSGLEINFRGQTDDGRHTWITLKGEDAEATERLAETILRSLDPNPPSDR